MVFSEHIQGLKYYPTVKEDLSILGRKAAYKDIRTRSNRLPSARLLTDFILLEMEIQAQLTPGAATMLETKVNSKFNWLAMT